MIDRAALQNRCENRIRRQGCFHLEMAPEAGRLDSSADFETAFEDCFLPILRESGRCGVFGPRAAELVATAGGWHLGEGGGYWKAFSDDYSTARACWSPEPISLEVSILVPLRLDRLASLVSLEAAISRCHGPDTASNPTAIVTDDAFAYARASSRKGDLLWLSFRSFPTNLYVTILGKPAVAIQWFRLAIANAQSDVWSCS
jgi:hypothetical protein